MKLQKIGTLFVFLVGSYLVDGQEGHRKFRYGLVQSFASKGYMPRLFPFGIDMGYSGQLGKSPLHFGVSGTYQNYGTNHFKEITTSHSIYRFGTDLSWDLVKADGFRSYVRGSLGINSIITRSYTGTNEAGHVAGVLFAIMLLLGEDEEDYDDDEGGIVLEPLVVLKRFRTFSPDYAVSLGLEWGISPASSFFVESGFRNLGVIRFVEKQNAAVTFEDIYYAQTQARISLVEFKVGLAHTF